MNFVDVEAEVRRALAVGMGLEIDRQMLDPLRRFTMDLRRVARQRQREHEAWTARGVAARVTAAWGRLVGRAVP